ncbi:response regulator [Nitrosopumilus sp. K4]|uniref:response regulator n=1 Tax=Nitrosopumilus sp. K4 TaxID=2795383 RepID=UPI0020114CD4|nr:response regulator [Nitrosopumilus sp. K4]
MSENKMDSEIKEDNLKILIIDDNEQITKMLTTFLSTQNFACIITNDAKEGLKMIEEDRYDAVLLDLALPDFNGYDVIDALEKNDMLRKNKIIVFTASNISEDELDKLVKRGVTSYILKPVDIDELLSKIQKVINT